jgi:hypothetical protein
MTIEFKIAQLERQTSNGFVTTVHWNASKTQGENTVGSYGTVGFAQEDGMNLIPFADLTEAVVIDWVKEKLDVEAMETGFDAQLAELAAPAKTSGMPWSN